MMALLKSPAVWGVALAGGVAILLLSRGSSGGGTNLSAVSLQAADQSNVALSGIGLQAHGLDLQASTQTFEASQASLATLAGQAFGFLTNSSNNATALQTNTDNINGSIAATKIAASTAISLDQQQNGNRVALANIGADSALSLAGVASGTTLGVAGIQSTTSLGLANIRNTLASIVTGGQLAYGQTVTLPIAVKQADVSQSIAEKQANEATNQQLIKSGFGAVSSLGGGLIGAFL